MTDILAYLITDLLNISMKQTSLLMSKMGSEKIDRVMTTFSLNSLIKMSVQTQKSVYATFVDLEKAFDRVIRNLLFYKLLRNNSNGKIYKAIKFLYTNTLSCVTVNGLCTQWF